MKKPENHLHGSFACVLLAALVVAGLAHLGVKLWEVQVLDAAAYGRESAVQSVRNVKTAGLRGRILDRHGSPLADNRPSLSLVCDPAAYQGRGSAATVARLEGAVRRLASAIGRAPSVGAAAISNHIAHFERSLPIELWRDVSERELARFSERDGAFPGFSVVATEARTYPNGTLAAHLLGFVGRGKVGRESGFRFVMPELRGREGVERYYDAYLRGVPGERDLLVDANSYTIREWTVTEAQRGPDLRLTIDLDIQRAAERELAGEKGACVVLDAKSGEVLAFASAPTFDPNACVPFLPTELDRRLREDPAKPTLNRASAGTYAPGSTFKPVTALAGLTAGFSADADYSCTGVYELGEMFLHCTARWGHGPIGMRRALMKSCNPYFCNLGMTVGTNALFAAARAFGLGAPTGIDFSADYAGIVPDAEWKRSRYGEKWFAGDLAQMSIGQGMLLVTPLQMALVAGAIGTGFLVTPHLKRDLPVERRPLPFAAAHLKVVREGMRMVVAGDGESRGTGWRGGEGVAVAVSGKTGTAEVGLGERRRKNTWFIAYAPSADPSVAVALVIENGQSGGGTSAPKVCSILKGIFNDR